MDTTIQMMMSSIVMMVVTHASATADHQTAHTIHAVGSL